MESTAPARGSYRTGRERVERILDAAHEVFISEGYRASSLRDIARASGISHPGLLRYFSSRAEILTALIERLDQESAARWDRFAREGTGEATPSLIAKGGREVPGWVELFTALLGEATSPSHPGHSLMLARRRKGAALGVEGLARRGVPSADAERALRLIVAGWEGLQILALYFPSEIDIVAHLERREDHLNEGAPVPESGAGAPPDPYPAGASAIVEAAATLYAQHGYYETSMQAVADRAGITRAALIHVAPTKEALLHTVLRELFGASADGDEILGLLHRPRWVTAAEVVLLCEATVPSHPAHAFFRERLAAARSSVEESLVGEGVEAPRDDADWIVASCLGILIAWLYEPDRVDPAGMLAGALEWTGPSTDVSRHRPATG